MLCVLMSGGTVDVVLMYITSNLWTNSWRSLDGTVDVACGNVYNLQHLAKLVAFLRWDCRCCVVMYITSSPWPNSWPFSGGAVDASVNVYNLQPMVKLVAFLRWGCRCEC